MAGTVSLPEGVPPGEFAGAESAVDGDGVVGSGGDGGDDSGVATGDDDDGVIAGV